MRNELDIGKSEARRGLVLVARVGAEVANSISESAAMFYRLGTIAGRIGI